MYIYFRTFLFTYQEQQDMFGQSATLRGCIVCNSKMWWQLNVNQKFSIQYFVSLFKYCRAAQFTKMFIAFIKLKTRNKRKFFLFLFLNTIVRQKVYCIVYLALCYDEFFKERSHKYFIKY